MAASGAKPKPGPGGKPPGTTDAPAAKPGFPGAAMPFKKGGGRKKPAKPKGGK